MVQIERNKASFSGSKVLLSPMNKEFTHFYEEKENELKDPSDHNRYAPSKSKLRIVNHGRRMYRVQSQNDLHCRLNSPKAEKKNAFPKSS